jgi:hypothetical protein
MNRSNNDLAIDTRDSYTFVFNSKFSTKTFTTCNECAYAIDWSIIPDQPYEVYFTYIGAVNNIDYTKLAQVFVDFGAPPLVYYANNTTGRLNTSTSQYLGYLKSFLLGTSSFFLAEFGTNTPIVLQGRPQSTTTFIRIYDNSNPMTLFAPATGNLNDYILTIKFVPISKKQ